MRQVHVQHRVARTPLDPTEYDRIDQDRLGAGPTAASGTGHTRTRSHVVDRVPRARGLDQPHPVTWPNFEPLQPVTSLKHHSGIARVAAMAGGGDRDLPRDRARAGPSEAEHADRHRRRPTAATLKARDEHRHRDVTDPRRRHDPAGDRRRQRRGRCGRSNRRQSPGNQRTRQQNDRRGRTASSDPDHHDLLRRSGSEHSNNHRSSRGPQPELAEPHRPLAPDDSIAVRAQGHFLAD